MSPGSTSPPSTSIFSFLTVDRPLCCRFERFLVWCWDCISGQADFDQDGLDTVQGGEILLHHKVGHTVKIILDTIWITYLHHTFPHSPKFQAGQGSSLQLSACPGLSASLHLWSSSPSLSWHTTCLCLRPPPQVAEHWDCNIRYQSQYNMIVLAWLQSPTIQAKVSFSVSCSLPITCGRWFSQMPFP